MRIEKETRADILNKIFDRMDKLEAIGTIGKGGDIMIYAEEAASIACVEAGTICKWGENGVIPRYKIEGAVRFGLREFCNWIAGCRQPSLSEKKNMEKKTIRRRKSKSPKAALQEA